MILNECVTTGHEPPLHKMRHAQRSVYGKATCESRAERRTHRVSQTCEIYFDPVKVVIGAPLLTSTFLVSVVVVCCASAFDLRCRFRLSLLLHSRPKRFFIHFNCMSGYRILFSCYSLLVFIGARQPWEPSDSRSSMFSDSVTHA
jgi:hypothetical protein